MQRERLMTFCVAGTWLAVRLGQMDRIALAEKLWGVPLAWSNHLGLFDDGQDLIPVLDLVRMGSAPRQRLIAILRARDERIAVLIDEAGRLIEAASEAASNTPELPLAFKGLPLSFGRVPNLDYWLLDADFLWQDEPARVAG
jgi:chemotaxis signal transduction protein